MADKYQSNPFQGIDVSVPEEFRETFQRYCQTGGRAVIDQSPFPRMVDLWFLAICVAARLGLKPAALAKLDTYKIIEGSIIGSDPWRVHALMLIAVAQSSELEIISEPRRMMALANGLAVAGLPKVVEMLKDGDGNPIWNISEEIESLLRKKVGA
ncbi:hypothetical protein [Oleispirillum naphthae]|uniref:hypothetical protein n=1 Tax=Oleispirillum naphthae TaxID=2838853 RepID=UPI0030825539